MKSYLLLFLITLTFGLVDIQRHQKIVDTVNNLKTTWKAKLYHRDIAPLIGAWKETPETQLPEKKIFKTSNEDLPESFDLREQYPQCESLKEIRDQSRCGSCWAFAAAETMSDRLCIDSNGQLQTRVSPLHLLSCCSNCGYGCFGGFPAMAFTYWKNEGIPTGGLYGDTTTCKPYFLPPCDNYMTQCEDYVDTPTCEETCQEGYPKTLEEDKTYGISSYSIKGVDNIMKEIYENGPVEATFLIYEDFGDYDSGVYQHVTGSSLGAHAVKILGWGVNEEGVKYWLVANSWNESWGEKGFFKIIRGTNDCGIESAVVSGMPKI